MARPSIARRSAALVALACLPVTSAVGQALPPDSVTTVYVTDTIAEYGAVGGVVADGLGYVYVADFRNAVWRLSPDGEVTKFADGLYGASGNAIGPRGHLFQSSFNGNFVSRISRTGEVETWADEGLSGPVGIAAAPDGTLFVVNCTGGSVSRISPQGDVSEFARHPKMACPNGITFDDRGDLYVVNFNDPTVLRITPDGEVSDFAQVTGAGGNGHIAFSRGAFYVTQLRGNQLFRVQRDGTVTVLAGTRAAGTDDGPALEATFTRPNGIAVSPSGNELWINDLTSGQGLGQGVSVVSLRRVRLMSLSDALNALSADADAETVRARYRAYHETRPGEDSSAQAITVGYAWLTAGRFAQAIEVFRLNAEANTDNANAQFHYGEVHRYTGSMDQAADQYRKVLALDPDHASAAARLTQVTGGETP